MATVPARPAPDGKTAETLQERFRRLEAIWNAETAHLSSTTKIMSHPAFQEIISIGLPVVSLMLRDLEAKPCLWVWALPTITGTDPVPETDRGNIRKMSEAWVQWGKANGYRW